MVFIDVEKEEIRLQMPFLLYQATALETYCKRLRCISHKTRSV